MYRIITHNNRKKHAKLRSESGASITFALLLFLVCAVVGSVVLAAGTAAAGRFSKIAEYDQRYYSVSSAAELLADLIDGQSVSAEITKQEEDKYTIKYIEETGASETEGPVSKEPVWAFAFSDGAETGKDILHDAVYAISGGDDPEASWNKTGSVLEEDNAAVYFRMKHPENIAVDEASVSLSELNVKIEETLHKDGSLEFVLYSSDDQYRLQLLFSAIVKTIKSNPSTITATSGNVRTDTTTTVKTTTVTWKLISIKVI